MFIWIGIFHLIHSPLFPFIVNTFNNLFFFYHVILYLFEWRMSDILYMQNNDKQYMAGSNVKYYPEMEYIIKKR